MEFSVKTLSVILGSFVVAFIIKNVVEYKFGETKNITRPHSYVTVDNVDKHLQCMALNIYREAGNEAFEGKVAVAQVTINRVNNPKFPKDICSVVYEKNIVLSKVICQFSWYCIPNLNKIPKNDKNYDESMAVAKKVVLEGFRLDMLNDALYYHADYVNPNWKKPKIGKIGTHIFYKG